MTKTWKLDKADSTDQHFWTDTDGAHISSTGDHDTSGFHQLLTSVKNAFMHGTTELATFGENLIELGKNSASAVIKFCAGTGEIGVIDSMLILFSDKVGVKGNSQAILASNGESNMAASKQNATYTGLAQAASTAPSTDADPASALLQAKYTKNSDGSTVSESYINLTAKPDGTAPATIKASEIAMNSSAQTNKYIRVKADSGIEADCPHAEGQSMHIGSYNTSTGQPIDAGITYIPIYGDSQMPAICLTVQQIQTPMYLIPMTRVETTLQPVLLYNGGAALTYDTPPTIPALSGTRTLSETAANFHALKLYYVTDDGWWGYVEVPFPNGKKVTMTTNTYNGVAMYAKSKTVLINGTDIDTFPTDNGNATGIWGSPGILNTGDYIGIVRVEGII